MMTLILGALVALLVGSLIISAALHNRQKAALRRQALIKQHLSKSDELLSYVTVLERYDPQYDLLLLVAGQAQFHLEQAYAQDRQNESIKGRSTQLAERIISYKAHKRSETVRLNVDTDSEMSSVFFQFTQLTRFIEILGNAGKLPRANVSNLVEYLDVLKTTIEVNSHIFLAEQQAAKKEAILYQAHLKQAIDILKKSKLDNETKNERIREISDRIAQVKATNQMVMNTIDTGRVAGEEDKT